MVRAERLRYFGGHVDVVHGAWGTDPTWFKGVRPPCAFATDLDGLPGDARACYVPTPGVVLAGWVAAVPCCRTDMFGHAPRGDATVRGAAAFGILWPRWLSGLDVLLCLWWARLR